jgi:peptidoglycan/xylan/chitin deacetylase (PgdA/CDA1 family)
MRARLKRLATALGWPVPARTCVLMYHRVAELPGDVWRIAVSPAHFEQHLHVLRTAYTVVPLPELASAVAQQTLRKPVVAVTFDDGYADNFLAAKPILEHYQIPATFFVASGNIGKPDEFWWDELEQLVLATPQLPAHYSGTIAHQLIAANLTTETNLTESLRQQHQHWDANTQAPPTQRAALFLELWRALRPLPHTEQQQHLRHLRQWAAVLPGCRPQYRSLASSELLELSSNPLFTIGVHTVSHPALASHSSAYQERELLENQYFLRQATTQPANIVAYPYGNFSPETLAVVAKNGFAAAVTTVQHAIRNNSNNYALGRFPVPDVPGPQFAQLMQQWQRTQ